MAVTAVSPGNTNFRVNGDSSPSPLSAESSFRELDDAFLQTQTRIWLGEVLQIRFDEETNISDILADGELLFEVAEVLSRVLPAPAAEAAHIRANESKSLVSSKSTRRYMPYHNVGTFLRMCKNLGLNGIDLFSPSDVVEKRDTRKVCMCIRSLSKKVRSGEINVPDFDSVVCTLAMPTDRVKGIRKSLEQSQCSSSFSTGPESGKSRRVRYWKRMSSSDSMASNGHFSNNCDEAETEHIAVESNQPSDYPGSELIRDDNSLPELQLNTGELENGENVQSEYLSPSAPESVGSPSSVYYSHQEMSTIPSSTFQASHIGGMNCNMQNDRQNGDINPVPFDWGDILSHDDYVLPHDEDNSDTASCGSCPVTRENKTYYAGIENLSCPSDIGCELSSCDSLERTHWNNFVSNRERDLDVSDECFDETSPYLMNENVDSDDIGHKIHPCELIKISSSDSNYVPQSYNEATNARNEAFDVKSLTLDPKEECNDGNSMGFDARHPMDLPEMNMNSSNTITTKDNKKWLDESRHNTLEVFEDHNVEGENMDDKSVDVEDIFSVNSSSTTLYSPEPEAGRGENVEGNCHKHHQFADNMEKDASDTKGIDQEMPQSKPHMTLLKSVAKSTAVVGVAVFLLHLRWKNTKAHIPKVKKEPIQVPKKTEKVRNSSSVYPSQNLHFGI